MLIDIALDAVGSDKAPEPEIRGAILACRSLPVRVHLVGPEAELRDLLDEHLENEDLPIVIHHASERIGMEEKAAHADGVSTCVALKAWRRPWRAQQSISDQDIFNNGAEGKYDGDIISDYTLSVQEVYTKAARHLILKTGRMAC